MDSNTQTPFTITRFSDLLKVTEKLNVTTIGDLLRSGKRLVESIGATAQVFDKDGNESFLNIKSKLMPSLGEEKLLRFPSTSQIFFPQDTVNGSAPILPDGSRLVSFTISDPKGEPMVLDPDFRKLVNVGMVTSPASTATSEMISNGSASGAPKGRYAMLSWTGEVTRSASSGPRPTSFDPFTITFHFPEGAEMQDFSLEARPPTEESYTAVASSPQKWEGLGLHTYSSPTRTNPPGVEPYCRTGAYWVPASLLKDDLDKASRATSDH